MTDPEDEAGDMDLRLETIKGFAGKLIQAVLGFAGTIVFARVLGPVSFGGFYLLLALVLIVDRPLRGLGQAVRKRYSESGAKKGEIVGTVLGTNVVFAVGTVVVVWVAREPLVKVTNVEGAPLVFVALLVSLSFFFPFQQMLAAQGWVAMQTWNDTLRSVFTLGLQLAFVFAGFGAAGMGYGLAGASIMVVPVALYYLRVRPDVPSRATVRSLWEYARFSTPGAFVGKAYDRFDVLLIGAVLTTASVGYYEVAYKLTVPAIFMPQIVSSGLMPKISNKHSKGLDIAEDISNAAAYISLLSIPIFFGALALARQIVVTAYGADYRAAAPLLVGLALYQVVLSQTKVYRQAIGGLDRPDLTLKIDIVTLVFNVVLGTALIFVVGVVGVVAATVAAESLRLLATAYAVRQITSDVEFVPQPLLAQIVAGFVMFLAVAGLARYIPLRTVPYVGAVVGAGAVVYGLVLLVISPGVRLTVRGVLQDAFGDNRVGALLRT